MVSPVFERWFYRELGFDEIELKVEVRVTSWGCPAQTYGPAENCYPTEPIELEIVRAWDPKNPQVSVTLTAAEEQKVFEQFQDDPPEDEDPRGDY